MNNDEQDTRYVKASRSKTPKKASHKHEYVRVYTVAPILRFDGTVTDQKYRLYLPPHCLSCGHVKRGGVTATEVEVSRSEYNSLKEEM